MKLAWLNERPLGKLQKTGMLWYVSNSSEARWAALDCLTNGAHHVSNYKLVEVNSN